MKEKIFLTLIFALSFSLIVGNASAIKIEDFQVSSPDEEPDGYFIHENNLEVSFKCTNASQAKLMFRNGNNTITSSNSIIDLNGEEDENVDYTNIDLNFNPNSESSSVGEYTLVGGCFNDTSGINKTKSKQIEIFDYQLKLTSPAEDDLKDYIEREDLSVSFRLKRIGKDEDYVTGFDAAEQKFTVFMGGKFLAKKEKPSVNGNNLTITSEIPNFDNFGSKDILIQYSKFPSVSDTNKDAVNVLKAFSIELESQKEIQRSSGGSHTVNVIVDSPLLNSNSVSNHLEFEYKIDDSSWKDISFSEITCTKESSETYACEVPISIPDKNPGSYDLKLRGNFKSYSDTVTKNVDFTIPVEGILTFANGQVVDAELQFRNEETGKWYSTETNSGTGKYSLSLLPGEYMIKIKTPEVQKIIIEDVHFDSRSTMITENSPIKMDSFKGGDKIIGINPVKLFVLEFGLEFDEADIWVQYDDTKVSGSENNLELYGCHEWNYGQRKCTGKWKTIPFNINTVTNVINFNTTEFSSYVIGNKKSLGLEVSLGGDEFFIGNPISFTGTVVDSDGDPIKNAEVTYEIEDTNISGKTYTDERGSFVGTGLKAPNDVGVYTIKIGAEKNPYVSIEATENIKVTKEKDFSLTVPDKVKLNLGENEKSQVTVVNSGQINFSSMSISLKGVPTNWYSVVPMTINKLEPGQSEKVNINFNVPKKACEEKCELYHFIDVIVKGEDIEKTASFTMEINKNVTDIQGGDGFSMPTVSLPTGNIIGNLGNPIAISGAVIFVLFFVVRKLKGSRNGSKSWGSYGSSRNSLASKLKRNSSQVSRKISSSAKNIPRQKIVPIFNEVKKNLKSNASKQQTVQGSVGPASSSNHESVSVSTSNDNRKSEQFSEINEEKLKEIDREENRLEDKINNEEDELEEIKKEKENISEKTRDVKEEYRKVKREYEKKDDKYENRQNKFTEFKKKLSDLKSKRSDLKQKKIRKENKIDSLENDIEDLKDRKNDLEGKKEKIVGKIDQTRTEKERFVGGNDIDITGQAEIQANETKERILKESLEETREDLREVSTNLKEKVNEKSNLENEMSEVQEKIEQADELKDNYKKKLNKLKEERDKLKGERNELHRKKDKKEKEKNKLERKLNNLNDKKKRKSERVSKLNSKLSKVSSRRSRLQ
ncbi:MAG: carboxypeptidase regulatory-like domain-containing protein [Candidatus Aenigmatarchaeota archaeon]